MNYYLTSPVDAWHLNIEDLLNGTVPEWVLKRDFCAELIQVSFVGSPMRPADVARWELRGSIRQNGRETRFKADEWLVRVGNNTFFVGEEEFAESFREAGDYAEALKQFPRPSFSQEL